MHDVRFPTVGRALAGLLSVLLLAGCQDGTGPAPTPARVELASREITMAEGAVDTLAVTVYDERGRPIPDLPVQWEVSDTAIASVDGAGVLRGKAPGSSLVFASLAFLDGSRLRDSARVVVRVAPARIEIAGWGGASPEGETPPVRFRVLDRRGNGVPGVEVRFSIARGSATLSRTTALTDSLGLTSVTLKTAGASRIEADVRASVEGVEPSYFSVSYLVAAGGLRPDSLVLTPRCTQEIFLSVRDPATGQPLTGQSADFTVEDSSLVSLEVPRISGSYRGVTRMVTATRPGSTRMVARWLYGGLTDTAMVRVESPRPARVKFTWPEEAVGIGAGVWAGASVLDQCGVVRPEWTVQYRNLDPEVISMGTPTGPTPSVRVRGLKPGVGRVVAETGALRDTLRVEVLDYRLLPADTTVAVGAEVAYRAVRVDAAGNQVPVPLLNVYPSGGPSGIVSSNAETKTVRALAPGTVELVGVVQSPHWPQRSGLMDLGGRITVVAPPGS